MARQLALCPVCESALEVSELTCSRCRARIGARFDRCRFCSLPAEHYAFLELFLRCEGNLSAVQKELDLSYPTVRNRFAALLSALGFAADAAAGADAQQAEEERRRSILNALSSGEIGAEEAARALRQE
jgi:hypothetical protein